MATLIPWFTESIATFVSQLRSIATDCNFGATLDQMLRDRLVCGVNNAAIQRRLLAEGDLTLAKAMDIAQGLESAATNAQLLQGDVAISKEIYTVNQSLPPLDTCTLTCFRCATVGHTAQNCRFKNAKCHRCGKIGHVQKACRSKVIATKQVQSKAVRSLQVEHQETTNAAETEEEYPLYNLSFKESNKPLELLVKIEGTPVTMELDTGAAVSVVSEDVYRKYWSSKAELQSTSVMLRMYSGQPLTVLGEMDVIVQYGDREVLLPLLIVPGKGPSLFGRNWLQHFVLNWKELRYLSVVDGVLQQYDEVFQAGVGTMKGYKAKFYVDTNVVPQFHKARSVPFSMRDKVDKELDRLVHEGILEPVQFAEWAAPIVPVLKSDKKSVRICGDFRLTVNRATKLDRYPIPKVEDLFAKLAGGQMFTKLDLSQAYQQIELEDSSKELVTINTQKGLYRYTRLPYGVASAPGIFQRTMENLLQVMNNVVVYIDNILITGTDDNTHLANLQEVLNRLKNAGLRLRRDKCVFMTPSVTYLGHVIDKEGLRPVNDKVKAIKNAPIPQNVSQLKSYLGLLNYYGKFLPNLSSKLAPLYQLLKVNQPWCWTTLENETFQQSKDLLTSTMVLTHFDPSKPITLSCDASGYGLGAVLSHCFPDGSEKPIGFVSRTLSPAERNYSQLEKEGLACIFGIKRFHSYVYGRHFTLITDHKPLLSLFNSQKPVSTQASGRIQRWALTLSMYEYSIQFKPPCKC